MHFPISIGLHRSRILDVVVLLFVLIASAAICFFPVSALIRMALFTLVCLLAVLAWRQLSPTIACLRLERGGEIAISGAGGDAFEIAKILNSATVHPWLTVFRLKTQGSLLYNVIITVDSLSASDFRRLRIFLRWRADFSAPDDGA